MICAVELSSEDGKTWAFVLRHRNPNGHETALYHSRRGFQDLQSATESMLILVKACDRITPETIPPALEGPARGRWEPPKPK